MHRDKTDDAFAMLDFRADEASYAHLERDYPRVAEALSHAVRPARTLDEIQLWARKRKMPDEIVRWYVEAARFLQVNLDE